MNIIAGHGGSAYNIRRMSFEAYDALPLGPPAEALGAEVITARLALGPMGTLRTGTLGMARIPAGWLPSPWPRLVRIKVESELGTGYIAAGIVEEAPAVMGNLSTISLVGVETAYVGGLGGGGSAIFGGGLISAEAGYGIAVPSADIYTVRQDAINKALEPFPNSEMGVAADLTALIGRPESAFPANLTSPGARSLGFSITKFITDVVADFGPDWQRERYQRSDVPVFAPRRSGQATINPATITNPLARPPTVLTGPWAQAVSLQGISPGSEAFTARFQTAGVTAYDKTRAATFRMHLEISAVTPWSVNGKDAYAVGNLRGFAVDASGHGLISYQGEIKLDAVKVLDLSVPYDGTRLGFGEWYFAFEVKAPQWDGSSTVQGNVTFTLSGAGVDEQRESRNTDGIVMPLGWRMPYFVGPTWEFTRKGIHVPPFVVTDRGNQSVAGADITFQDGNASTKLLTAALPYPGQKRGA